MAKVKGESNEVLKVRPGAWQLHLGRISTLSTPSVGCIPDQEQVAAICYHPYAVALRCLFSISICLLRSAMESEQRGSHSLFKRTWHVQAMPHQRPSATAPVARRAASPDERAGGDDAQLAWTCGWRAPRRSGSPRRLRCR